MVTEYLADLALKQVLGLSTNEAVGLAVKGLSLGLTYALEAAGWNSAVGIPGSSGSFGWPIIVDIGVGGGNYHPDVVCDPNVIGRAVARTLSLQHGKKISFADVCFGGFELCGKFYKIRCPAGTIFMGFVKNVQNEWEPRCIPYESFVDFVNGVNDAVQSGRPPHPECPDPENMDMWGYDGYGQPICTPKISKPTNAVQWVDSTTGIIRYISCPPGYKPVDGVSPDGTIDCFDPKGGVFSAIRYVPFPSDEEKANRIRPDDYVAYGVWNGEFLSIPREKPPATTPTSPVALPPKQIYTPHPPIYSDSGRCPDGWTPTGRNVDNQLICQRCPAGYIPIAVGDNGKLICMEKPVGTAPVSTTSSCPSYMEDLGTDKTGKRICLDYLGKYGPIGRVHLIDNVSAQPIASGQIKDSYAENDGTGFGADVIYPDDPRFLPTPKTVIHFPPGIPLDLRRRLEAEVKQDTRYSRFSELAFLGFDTSGKAQFVSSLPF